MTGLLLIRRENDTLAIRGELHWSPAPGFMAYTLEDAGDCIPVGTFPLRLRHEGGFASRYGHAMVEIVVPGRKYILFHKGNYHRDSRGCILVGENYGYDTTGDGAPAVWNSASAYQRIYPMLRHAAERDGTLTVR